MRKENFGKAIVQSVVALAGFLFAQATFAQFVAGDGTGRIRLDNSFGAGPGGEFTATVLNGGSGTFQTFCLERNEYFSYGQTLQVRSITSSAMAGGVGGAVGGSDPLDSRTAYLYTKFSSFFTGGTGLSGYDYNSATLRPGDADALQNAIWFLENEITSVSGQALTWVNEATSAVNSGSWTGLGRVQVLNLYRGTNFNTHAQDQLYITPVPEPETYMMLLAGLGLMGFVARRRQRALAA